MFYNLEYMNFRSRRRHLHTDAKFCKSFDFLKFLFISPDSQSLLFLFSIKQNVETFAKRTPHDFQVKESPDLDQHQNFRFLLIPPLPPPAMNHPELRSPVKH